MPNTKSNTVNHVAIAHAPAAPPYRKAHVSFLLQFAFAWFVFASTALAQTTDPNSVFSDLSTEYDGGVANPTDGSTGNVLQQTLFAAYFWGQAHHAHATVVVASEYPVSGTRILVPGNVDLVCSSYSQHTYGGGCILYQAARGDGTASGGSPLLMADSRFGVLADHKTLCSSSDNPAQPGCTVISSSGASIRGFTLYGNYLTGGADVGISVFDSSNVHIEDTNESQFGGSGIVMYGGLNDSADWNFGTNVDKWWCYNPSHLTHAMGGMDLGMIDGEASNNQYSTGCAFAKSFTVSLEYPYLAAMHVTGAGNLIDSNLLQCDGVGLIVEGFDMRVVNNRIEYIAREAIRNLSAHNTYADNRITSACLDPNLINLMPGSLDNGTPRYPKPTFLHNGYMIMDPSGNIEQVISGAGTSDAAAPDWSVEPGGTTIGDQLTWQNMGPWPANNSPLSYWAQPTLVTGKCYSVYSIGGGGDVWSGNQVRQDAGVNGGSYMHGSYFLADVPETITGNTCDSDLPDAYGNGQCWWGGDLFSNGGPAYLAPNGMQVTTSGGGTAWVGDYSVLVLADNVSRHYNNFQGMSEGQTFSVTSSTVANVIDPWGITPTNWNLPGTGSIYGHPSLQTCSGRSLVVAPGSYYQFYYHLSTDYAIRQINCPSGPTGGNAAASVSPGSLDFGSQGDATTSVAQTVTVTNPSPSAISIAVAISDEFAQTNNCGGALSTGASCTISVTFTPTTTGAVIGNLTISDNVGGSSLAVTLTGVGTELKTSQPGTVGAIILSSSVATFDIVTGHTAKTVLTVTSQNDYTGVINLACEVVPLTHATQNTFPTCSLSPAQVGVNGTTAGVSTLVVSAQASSVVTAVHYTIEYRGIALAGLSLLGLLPFAGLRRRAHVLSLVISVSIMLAVGMAGCGYGLNSNAAPLNSSGTYKVVITATSGTAAPAAISIPMNVQQQ